VQQLDPPKEEPRLETRCGWLDNPTPGNVTLTDKDGEWVIAVQGGYRAEGADDLPDFNREWVAIGAGSYGYGCACARSRSMSRSGKYCCCGGSRSFRWRAAGDKKLPSRH